MAQEEGEAIIPEITCQEIAQWASDYLDEHVGDDRKRQIAVHLAICAGCETYVKQVATVRDVVGLLPRQLKDRPILKNCGRPLWRGHADHHPAVDVLDRRVPMRGSEVRWDHRVNVLENYAEMMQMLTTEKSAIKVFVNVELNSHDIKDKYTKVILYITICNYM